LHRGQNQIEGCIENLLDVRGTPERLE
jgi:hypothetical protein